MYTHRQSTYTPKNNYTTSGTRSSMERRKTMMKSSPTARRTALTTSTGNRIRFWYSPPQASARLFVCVVADGWGGVGLGGIKGKSGRGSMCGVACRRHRHGRTCWCAGRGTG